MPAIRLKNTNDVLSILIVDDDPMVLELLAKAFQRYGFKVFRAQNGLDGWELFKKEGPEIILTDIQMPGLDGAELACRIHNHSPAAKIAVMTGGLLDVGNNLVNQGIVDHCFQKPITISRIYEAFTAASIFGLRGNINC